MIRLLRRLAGSRIGALIRKEFNQIRHDRRLAVSLILPPALQLVVFGFALSANVDDLPLGVVDDSKTPESRELIATLSGSKSFRLSGYYFSIGDLGDALGRGTIDTGVVIPSDFARDLQRGSPATVQVLLNAMNANTAAISQGYVEGVIQSYNNVLARDGLHAVFRRLAAPGVNRRGRVLLQPDFLYNPGLEGSWFIVTGVIGLLLILNSSIVASGAMVKERAAGTIEQLLMSPASTTEIIIAKIAPLFLLLTLMMFCAIGVARVVFGVPFHGSLVLVLGGGALCILCGISIGTVIATFSKSAQQAMLTSFFVNPPLSTMSGAFSPVEAMPGWLQPVAAFNPVYHFVTIVRGSMLKGSGFATLWPNFAGLAAFTLVLVAISVWRFRKQLS
ncbi:MAG TPA: ABC transporter permease [Blastocatellia bacterium]|nr:ABC transporter permease [Blastocatellia bacterium]